MKKTVEGLLSLGGVRRDVIFLVLGGIGLLVSFLDARLQFWPLSWDPAWVAIVLCGLPIVAEAIVGLVTAFDIKADVLVSMALIASVIIGEYFAAGEIAFIMQVGALLEELTVARARAGLERLVHLTPQTARVLAPEGERVVPAEQVRVGALLRVLPGETVPVDGTVVEGETSIDQSVVTGEPMPEDKQPGDPVFSGTVNRYGAFDMRADKACQDSSMQRMIRLTQSADAGKAKIVGLADRWATWIVVTALAAAALTWLFSGQIIRAVTILVVFCPCALVLATPTAIMAAIGNATKHGFLVREGDALERLAGVSYLAFDKTGTLTRGTPAVVQVQTVSRYTAEEIFALAACAEVKSEHPLGKAIIACFPDRPTVPESFAMLPGRGVAATAGGREILAGNRRLLAEYGVPVPETFPAAGQVQRGGTAVLLAVDGALAGFIVLADTVREDSPGMIAGVSALGCTSVLLTGDGQETAEAIAERLGIREIRANCLPEEKLRQIELLQTEGAGVCMIGDGVNDAPALKKAAVGIAMGGIGSDIAVDAADIALVNDEIGNLPYLLALSRRMMKTIRWNLVFAMGLNFAAIVLAITGFLGPVVGALVHNAGSVLVIIHSALLLGWKQKGKRI